MHMVSVSMVTQSLLSNFSSISEELSNAINTQGTNYNSLFSLLSSQPNRMARLEYLRCKVSQPGPSTELDNGNFEVHPGEYKLRYSNLLTDMPESEHKMAHAMHASRDGDGAYSSREGLKKLQSSSHGETTPAKGKGVFGFSLAGLVTGW